MNAATAIVLVLLIAAVFAAAYATWRRVRRGSDAPACGCSCAGCSKASSCADFFVPVEEAGE